MGVEIFKTNVTRDKKAQKILIEFRKQFPEYTMNFDLEDCDRVLRIEGSTTLNVQQIIQVGKTLKIDIQLIDY